MTAPRTSTSERAAGYWVGATALDDEWQCSFCIRYADGTGVIDRYLTTQEARELAAALIRAADHYDAETARLAQQVAA